MCFIATSNLLTRLLVYSSTTHIIKFNAQCSKFKGKSIPQQTVSSTPPLSRRGGWGVRSSPIGYIYVK